ncbi:MAG: hypothetical protein KatS3mg031_1544 [Chitinophagales bacterium]|nr:MAG: hypothetical protein KatS3mg031_1544 [Chitinophagales bacterium]
MSIRKKIAVLIFACSVSGMMAKENIGSGKTSSYYKGLAASCSPASAQIDLDINNVRTTLLNGGDLWWNLNDARYEIPKVPAGSANSVHSLFAGAIWLGGIDAGGNLKVAAQTYRQSGNDFWPGPLDGSGSVTKETCDDYNRFWKVNGADIDAMLALCQATGGNINESDIPESILEWPAKGNLRTKSVSGATMPILDELAPFYDADGDGLYDPTKCDFPVINPECGEGNVYADQMIFWVYNDKGNIHTETGGEAIGIQVNALAFAFATSDEVNDMTFYRYKLINKGSSTIGSFYMAQWVDPDLGCYNNDYVGCDTSRSLGICYNGTATDPDCASRGYGNTPPLVGVDYFEGPLSDPDSNGVRRQLGMSTFTYYNNDFTVQGNPETAVHYYNYMTGFWKDNTCFTQDAPDAYGGSQCTKYMFPSNPPDAPYPTFWSECSVNNIPADRRFLQSSGPFTLKPGDVNNITVGVVWVRPSGVYPCPSFETTIGPASDKAQALFDNCFKLVDGPDAPTLVIRELDRELIISLVNLPGSNNFNEAYEEVDPVAAALAQSDSTITDTTYKFQGYKLYQLKNAQVSVQELEDVSKARLIAQVDVRDGVSKIINYYYDATLNADVPKLMVDGANNGIRKTFRITEDQFASGSKSLVNHKTYYFTAIAYAYNNYKPYNIAATVPSEKGQALPYLQGRKNYQIYSGIPHKPEPARGGTDILTKYGDGVKITRLEGEGNSGISLELTDSSEMQILNSPNHFYGPIQYKENHGPIDVKVYDPMKVKNADFIFTMQDTTRCYVIRGSNDCDYISPAATWRLEIREAGSLEVDTVLSERNISDFNEQLIAEYGISINLKQVNLPGKAPNAVNLIDSAGYIPANGFIEASIEFTNPLDRWLTGIADASNVQDPENWIRSGQYSGGDNDRFEGFFDDHLYRFVDGRGYTLFYDPDMVFGNILGGTWAPYGLATNRVNKGLYNADPRIWNTPYSYGPAFLWRYRVNLASLTSINYFRITENTLHNLHSVDVVLTSDKSKWTRCVVIELGEDSALTEGHAMKGQIRMAKSWDRYNGYHGQNQLPEDTGRSWFPGYAINVETGERLNMMFGEDSWLVAENGRDMIWNPTSNVRSPVPGAQPLFGGKHYIYVMNTRYDEGAALQRAMLDSFNLFHTIAGSGNNRIVLTELNNSVYSKIMWVSMAVLAPGYELKSPEEGIVPNDVKIRLRVNVPYKRFYVDGSNNGAPKYAFSTRGLETKYQQTETARTACDLINVVPNPYYAYSAYETSQLDNRIKITNLPDNCTVTIYTLNGVIVRKFERAVTTDISPGNPVTEVNLDNTIDWDLKNSKGIPVASGIYLIHVKADGVCERVVKWFGALRPTDLDTF